MTENVSKTARFLGKHFGKAAKREYIEQNAILPRDVKAAETLASLPYECTFCGAGVNEPCHYTEGKRHEGRTKPTSHSARRVLGAQAYAAWVDAQ